MANLRGVLLVSIILLVGIAVGALAGYRMHLQEAWNASAEPVLVRVTIDGAEGTHREANVTVQGSTANALGALEAAADVLDVVVGVRETGFGSYVHTIGAERASGTCGWLYGIGGVGHEFQPANAADLEPVDAGDWIAWYWGCI